LREKKIVQISADDMIKATINRNTCGQKRKKERERQQVHKDSNGSTVNNELQITEETGNRRKHTGSTRKQGESMVRQAHFIPTHPRTSTREKAVVGAAGAMKDRGRPRDPLIDKRGVFRLGNARVFTLGVRIIVEGAALGRASGEGGKTNNVCDGVGSGCEGAAGLGGV
jgi:hypothetical protein